MCWLCPHASSATQVPASSWRKATIGRSTSPTLPRHSLPDGGLAVAYKVCGRAAVASVCRATLAPGPTCDWATSTYCCAVRTSSSNCAIPSRLVVSRAESSSLLRVSWSVALPC